MKIWALLLAAIAPLSGCQRNTDARTAQLASAPAVGGVPLSRVDLGDSLLAEVNNARYAIVLRDPISAANDVRQALNLARELPDHPSHLIRSEPTGALGHEPLTVFRALAKLTSAQAELDNSNLKAADADLRDIQDAIPPGLIPNDLLLLRAAASLDLAMSAASEVRITDLKTQLLSAQLALETYPDAAHAAEARALAATIRQRLTNANSRDTLLPAQVSLWLGTVVEWGGADRWSSPAR